jgi:hypothetical protein
VESVSPDEVKVLLDIDSPRNTALNTGVPISFPRINSFVLLPNETGAVVGIVVWLGVERSAYPKRPGLKDFGLIDLPFPLRKMALSPIGTLTSEKNKWVLERGVQSFPSVGDNVILPTQEQTIAIVTGHGKDSRIKLGTCPSAHDAPILVDPDKLFGRHLAVIGNTGSGKSCTLAALVRSSIESAQASIKTEATSQEGTANISPNARFIILDPNGEYSKCFQDLGSGCRVFQVPPLSNNAAKEFILPAWMWNSSEWAAVAQAAPRAQRPLLQAALRNLRANKHITLTAENRLFARCKALESFLLQFAGTGAIGFQNSNNCGQQLTRFWEDISNYTQDLSGDIKARTERAAAAIKQIIDSRMWTGRDGRTGFNDFGDTDLSSVGQWLENIFQGFSSSGEIEKVSEDSPLPFDPVILAEHLESLAMQEGGAASQFISTLTMRINAIISDTRMNDVINPEQPVTLRDWLENHIGSNNGVNGPVTVIDLSLVPYEILHLVIAVASRLIFESLQRYRKINNSNLPTVLVLEEAHTFVAKKLPRGDEIPSPADMCRSVFERIAREGRKFGLGLVLSSQRPSELSETVLSQCNSFLLHRITNDRDQELVNRLVPDTARGLLKELPSLPTRHCILLGIASKVPVLIEVRDLEKEHRPESEDPDFWDVWTLKNERNVDWNKIADDWIGKSSGEPDEAGINKEEGE